jgi:hypothetical protein
MASHGLTRGSPTPIIPPTAAERLGQPPSVLGLAWQASGWHDAGGLDWKRERQWGKVLGRSSDGIQDLAKGLASNRLGFGFCCLRLEGFPRTLSKSVRGTREEKESGVATGAARDRGGPGVARGQFSDRQPVPWGELGVAEFLRGRRPARLWQASGPHWAASAKGVGRPTGPLGLSWATREWGRQKRLAGPGSASS